MSFGPPHLGHPAIAPYNYKALGQFQIRVLTLAPGEFSDEIHIRLHHVDLKKNSDVDYEALSYVWGTSEPTQHVIVDAEDGSSQSLPVRDNLADALRHIRDTTTVKSLWVDALCMNQEDNGEKSHQVPFMTQIYRDATRVIVWLGTECEDSAFAMELLQNLGANMELDWTTGLPTYSDAFLVFRRALRSSASSRQSIATLLDREWFERLWVHQEIYLSRRATVRCGSSEAEWSAFITAALFFTISYGHRDSARMYQLAKPDPIVWQQLRSVVSGKKCIDPRDKIYGMLSMLKDNNIHPLKVDYTLSVPEVYTAATKHYVQTYGDLSLFESCDLTSNRMKRLPSWVPDWSASPEAADLWDVDALAMGKTSSFVKFPKTGTMRLAGVMSSEVRSVEPLGRTFDEAKSAMLRILRMVRVGERYAKGDQGDALICAIIAGRYKYSRTPPQDYKPTKDTCCIIGRYLVSSAAGTISDGEAEPACFLELMNGVDQYWKDRALFLTKDGHIGLGHQCVTQGDCLFFPLGSQWPLAIRSNPEPQRNEWSVVSVCYISGLMLGEVLYGSLPSNSYLVFTDNFSEPGREFEKERTRKAFGVEDEKLLTPELLRSKGVPVEWIDLV